MTDESCRRLMLLLALLNAAVLLAGLTMMGVETWRTVLQQAVGPYA